jgi:hypothetical protein
MPMTVEIKNNKLIIEIDLEKPTPADQNGKGGLESIPVHD